MQAGGEVQVCTWCRFTEGVSLEPLCKFGGCYNHTNEEHDPIVARCWQTL